MHRYPNRASASGGVLDRDAGLMSSKHRAAFFRRRLFAGGGVHAAPALPEGSHTPTSENARPRFRG
jgi:hypothetical protein